MKSNSKPTVSSSDYSQKDAFLSKRQQEAFIARSKDDRNRLQRNENMIGQLRAAQFQMANTIEDIERSFKNTIDQTIKENQRKIDEVLNDATQEVNRKVETLNTSLDKQGESLNRDLDKKVLEARNKIIEPVAIFVGLFTFVSIGFQIFTQVKEYILWMPLLGAVLGGIIIFAGLIIHASSMNSDASERRKYTAAIIAIGVIIFVCAGVYYHEAIDVMRSRESKNCVMVKAEKEAASEDLYCRYLR